MKNVEVVYSDLCLKVNVPKINYVEVLDFPFEVDFDSALNKVQLTDSSLEVFLVKSVPQTWPEL
jgi:hypothetical protein